MKIYAFDLMPWPHLEHDSFYPDPNVDFDPTVGCRLYEDHLKQIELYDECGFDAICFNEHHATPYGLMPSPNVMAAAVVQRTRRLKVGIFGNLLPLHAHPVRLAEELAMLDVMSGGRIISGFTKGVVREFLAYSVAGEHVYERIDEAWELIVKAWTERAPFAWHGKFYDYDRVSIWPRPFQQPHPPVVYFAESDDGLQLAARRRAGTGVAFRSTAKSAEVLQRYRVAASRNGWSPSPEQCMVLRHVYVAETREQARREAETHLVYFWQRLLSYHKGVLSILGQAPPPRPAEVRRAEDLPFWEFDFDLCQRDGLSIIGDPEYVVDEIRRQEQELGIGVLIGFFQFGSMPHEQASRNIRLFSERVLPKLG